MRFFAIVLATAFAVSSSAALARHHHHHYAGSTFVSSTLYDSRAGGG
ncbi:MULTISPECIES: hypothetical protein [unclassified Bradyrhizobium]|nr:MULTISPECIES: hypothetical protein [unclassified Bradyrhizobium]WGR70492.1 hypothetical protein MTX24_34920 [Bradyrhizobium sp. ISRA426]WGR82548.1 hypothetical protein MTX21_20020 [Bradyrhizobium sp. ISRA430]WGR85735.1 hypothetical protein MTX25_34605 [Bradyrhizobium sp. ISRA432]